MARKQDVGSERRAGSARERLLAAADELFYEGGIHTVGIERVLERAGVAKASLYDCFGSKDELIRAYLQSRHEARKARLTQWLQRYATPREQLLGVFDALRESMAAPGFRGCAFARVTAEAQPSAGVKSVCDEARSWLRELLTTLASEAGAADASALALQLALLYDGALAASQFGGGVQAAEAARTAAALMVDAAIPARSDGATVAAEDAVIPTGRKHPARR
jgi:AcrR family transcriptional regulator